MKSDYDLHQQYLAQRAGTWVKDAIHNGEEGRARLWYKPHVFDCRGGLYVRRTGGTLSIGTFSHAVPHIGEAIFTTITTRYFNSAAEADEEAVDVMKYHPGDKLPQRTTRVGHTPKLGEHK